MMEKIETMEQAKEIIKKEGLKIAIHPDATLESIVAKIEEKRGAKPDGEADVDTSKELETAEEEVEAPKPTKKVVKRRKKPVREYQRSVDADQPKCFGTYITDQACRRCWAAQECKEV